MWSTCSSLRIDPSSEQVVVEDTGDTGDTGAAQEEFEPYIFTVSGSFGWDADSGQVVPWIQDGVEQPARIRFTFIEKEALPDGPWHTCAVDLSTDTALDPATWASRDGVWLGFQMPPDADVTHDCEFGTAFDWGDAGELVQDWTWGLAVISPDPEDSESWGGDRWLPSLRQDLDAGPELDQELGVEGLVELGEDWQDWTSVGGMYWDLLNYESYGALRPMGYVFAYEADEDMILLDEGGARLGRLHRPGQAHARGA